MFRRELRASASACWTASSELRVELRSQLRSLRLRTDYAVVTVSLLPKDGDQGGGAGGSFDDALDDAGGLLVGVAGLIVRALAVALPLGLIALVGWLTGRAVRRRQRESALA